MMFRPVLRALLCLTVLAVFVAPRPTLAAQRVNDRLFRLTYDRVEMPGAGEPAMGLVGLNYLVRVTGGFYAGLGAYGAVDGERGGFFTGGLEVGWRDRLYRSLWFDAGAFVGGGGGGAAPQGGGLMLRPHVGLALQWDKVLLGLQYSLVNFPNGDIDSHGPALVVEIPYTALTASAFAANRMAALPPYDAAPLDLEILLTGRSYFPTADALRTSGQPLDGRIDLVGIEFRRYLGRTPYLFLATAGAFGGAVDGYAEVLGGAGLRWQPFGDHRLGLLASLGLGGGGGGTVDSGGGALARGEVGLSLPLFADLALEADGGYVQAFDGNFAAWTAGARLSYTLHSLRPGRGMPDTDIFYRGLRIRGAHQTYLDADRKDGSTDNVNLVGFAIDAYLTPHLYLSGQGYGAYAGGAGGFATGFLGGGIESYPLWGRLRLFAEGVVGAAGGGGVDVGDGLLAQGIAGVEARLGRAWGLRLGGGWVQAFDRSLSSPLIDLALTYHFSVLERH